MKFPRSEHPTIRTHPVTGPKALFVNRGFTTRIAQLNRNESDAVLDMLYRHIETPDLIAASNGSPVTWPSGRIAAPSITGPGIYYPLRRSGRRVTVCGDQPLYRA